MAEDLKKSKNVRQHTRNLPRDVATKRMVAYLRRVGLRAREGTQNRFGVGRDQRELVYKDPGSPAHEAGHALMTPVGQDLRSRQRHIGQVGTSKGITPDESLDDENAAYAMEPKLGRRAGVRIEDSNAHKHYATTHEIRKIPGGYTPRSPAEGYALGQEAAARELTAVDEGRKVIGPKGQVQQGTSVDAKINARAMRKDETGFPKWRDQYPMVDADHSHHLETAAAIQEFMHKVPRHQAEAAAHEEYRKDQLAEAAAHHLVGMKAAHAAGALEDAKKHGVLYALAAKQLGFDPAGEPPSDITTKEKNLSATKPVYKFKSHKGDAFALPQLPPAEQQVQKAEPPGRLPADTQAAISADPAAVERATLRPAFHNPSTGEVHAMDSAWHNTDELAEKTGNPQGWDPDPEEWVAGFSDHRGQFYDRYQAARKVQGRSIEPDDYEDCPDHLESLNYYQGVKDGYYKSESSLEKAAPPPITGEYGHHLPQKLRAAGYSLTVEHAGTEFVNNRYVPQARALLYVKGKPILSASTRPDGSGLDYHELDLKSRQWKPSAGVAFPGLEQGFHGALAEHLGPHAAEAGVGTPPMPYLRKDDVLQLPGAAATPPVQPDRKAGGMKVASLLGHKRKVAAQAREAAQAAPLPSGTPDELLEQGTDLHDAGDVHNAARFYRSAINANPNMFEAHLNLGQLLHDSGDPMAAYSHYETAGRLKPSDPTVHFNLGVAQEDMGHTQDAINHYRAALQLDPAMADAHFNIARLHEQIGDTQSAIRHLNEHRRLSSGKGPSAPPAETSPKGFVQSVREWPQDGPTTVRNSSLAPANDNNSVIKPSAPPAEGKVIPFQRSELRKSADPRFFQQDDRGASYHDYSDHLPEGHGGLVVKSYEQTPYITEAHYYPRGEKFPMASMLHNSVSGITQMETYGQVLPDLKVRMLNALGSHHRVMGVDPPMSANLQEAHRPQNRPSLQSVRSSFAGPEEAAPAAAGPAPLRNSEFGLRLESLAKRSKNVREMISKITPRQAEQRRVKYAQSIGLKPVKDPFINTPGSSNFPQASRSKLPYGDSFGIEHETAHAMMTPSGKTVRQYQDYLSSHAKPQKQDEDSYEPDDDHYETQLDDVRANQLENLIDRRAGVAPSKFRSEFRTNIVGPRDQEEMPEGWVDEEATKRARRSGLPRWKRNSGKNQRSIELPNPEIRSEAQDTARDFDEGARFTGQGKITQSRYGQNGPHGSGPLKQTLDQRINRGLSGVNWLRDYRERVAIKEQNARMNGGGGPYPGWNKGR